MRIFNSSFRGNKLFRCIDYYCGILLCQILGSFSSSKRGHNESQSIKYQKILVIKLSAMGDTVLLIPSLRALCENYPSSNISMIVTGINKEIMKSCPYVDELLYFDIRNYIKNPLLFLIFIIQLRKMHFDLALDFDQWLRVSPLLGYFSGAYSRIGFKTEKQHRHYLYTKAVPHRKNKHELECFLEIVQTVNVGIKNKELELWIEKEDEQYVDEFLGKYNVKKGELLVGIHPCCGLHGWPREWRGERYVEIIDYLENKWNAQVILSGSQNEGSVIVKIATAVKGSPIVAYNKLSLGQLISLIKRCRFVISGNTGITHIAAAMKTPTITLHGPTNPAKWGPRGKRHIIVRKELHCSPCLNLGFEYGCYNHTCMDVITVEDVIKAIHKVMHPK